MPAHMNRGDRCAFLRGSLLMTAVIRYRCDGLAGGTRRFARDAREGRGDDRQSQYEGYSGPGHASASIRDRTPNGRGEGR